MNEELRYKWKVNEIKEIVDRAKGLGNLVENGSVDQEEANSTLFNFIKLVYIGDHKEKK